MDAASNLDAPCGEYFTLRELIECGATWHRLATSGVPVDNVPVAAGTLAAMGELCRVVLDPLTRRFARPELTYGFASRALTRHIRAGICPSRDQHAGFELNHRGSLVCARSGMAVDLRVRGVPARTLATWIEENAAFDRLYIYGDDRPIHVSIGPQQKRAIVEMIPLPNGHRVPRLVRGLR